MTSRADSFLLHEWDDGETDPYELSAREAWRDPMGEARPAEPEPSRFESPSARPEEGSVHAAMWRPLGLFWGILLGVAGLVAVGLEIAGPPAARPSPHPAAQPLTPATPPAPMFPPLASVPAVTPREPLIQAQPPATPVPPKRPPITDSPAAPLTRPLDLTAGLRPPPPAAEPAATAKRPPTADNSALPAPRLPDAAAGTRAPLAPDQAATSKRPPIADNSAFPAPRPPDPTAAPHSPAAADALAPEPPRAPRKQAAVADGSPPDQAQAYSPLIIHYPSGSYATLTDAQRLAEQADLGSAPAVVPDGGTSSPAATIKYFESQDHASALALGKTLAKLGYKWRIERATGQPPAALEVFMPVK